MKHKIFFILGNVMEYYKVRISKRIFRWAEKKSWLFILVSSLYFFFLWQSCSVVLMRLCLFHSCNISSKLPLCCVVNNLLHCSHRHIWTLKACFFFFLVKCFILYKFCLRDCLRRETSWEQRGRLPKGEWPDHPSQVSVFSVEMWDFLCEGWWYLLVEHYHLCV